MLTKTDLGEMFGLVMVYKDNGFSKVQLDTDHAEDIIMLAIKYLEQQEALNEQ